MNFIKDNDDITIIGECVTGRIMVVKGGCGGGAIVTGCGVGHKWVGWGGVGW